MDISFLLLLLMIFIGLQMFFAVRRQRKAMQATIDLHESLLIGDRVHTAAGLAGTVRAITDDAVDLEIAPGVVTTWKKMAIADKIDPVGVTADDDDTEVEDGAWSTGADEGDTPPHPQRA
jgi:preprotein translocase subunit YajC